jgi:hypothetical protein
MKETKSNIAPQILGKTKKENVACVVTPMKLSLPVIFCKIVIIILICELCDQSANIVLGCILINWI